MMTEEDFVREIYENHNKDNIMLVFSDWLEESGRYDEANTIRQLTEDKWAILLSKKSRLIVKGREEHVSLDIFKITDIKRVTTCVSQMTKGTYATAIPWTHHHLDVTGELKDGRFFRFCGYIMPDMDFNPAQNYNVIHVGFNDNVIVGI